MVTSYTHTSCLFGGGGVGGGGVEAIESFYTMHVITSFSALLIIFYI